MHVQRLTRRWWVLAIALQLGPFAFAQTGASEAHWVATWATRSNNPGSDSHGEDLEDEEDLQDEVPAGQPAGAPAQQPPQTPAAALPRLPRRSAAHANTLDNQTARMIVRTSIGGNRIRVQFSNAFGTAPLDMGAAHVAIRSKDSAIVAGSDRPLLFNGKASAGFCPARCSSVTRSIWWCRSSATSPSVCMFPVPLA